MYVYFDSDGVLKEIISEPTRKASSDYTKIFIYWDNKSVVNNYWVVFEKPDGTKTNEIAVSDIVSAQIPYNPKRDLRYFEEYKTYKFIVITLPDEVLSQEGLVLCTFRAVLSDDSIFSFGLITFNVEKNVIKEDSYLTQSQYDYFVKLLSNAPTWSLIEQYIGITREQIVDFENYTDYLQKKIFNLTFEKDETTNFLNSITFNEKTYYIKNYDVLYNQLSYKIDSEVDLLKESIKSILGYKNEIVEELPDVANKYTLYWLKKSDNDFSIYLWDGNDYKILFEHLTFNPNDFVDYDEFTSSFPLIEQSKSTSTSFTIDDKSKYVVYRNPANKTSWGITLQWRVRSVTDSSFDKTLDLELPEFDAYRDYFILEILSIDASSVGESGSNIKTLVYEINGVRKTLSTEVLSGTNIYGISILNEGIYALKKFNLAVTSVKPYKVFIAYADDLEGTNFSTTYNNQYYIGTYVGMNQPQNASYYTWSRFKGDFVETIYDDTTTQINEEFKYDTEKTFGNENITSVQLSIPNSANVGFMSDATIRVNNPSVTFSFVNNSKFPLKILQYGIGIKNNYVAEKKCLVHLYCHCDGLYSYVYIQEILN